MQTLPRQGLTRAVLAKFGMLHTPLIQRRLPQHPYLGLIGVGQLGTHEVFFMLHAPLIPLRLPRHPYLGLIDVGRSGTHEAFLMCFKCH